MKVLMFGAGLASLGAAVTRGGIGYLFIPGSAPTQLSTDFTCPAAISPDGRLLAVVQRSPSILGNYQVEVYDLASRRRVAEYVGGLSALAFSPDSKRLAVSGIFRVIVIDPYTGEEIMKGP